VSDAPIPLSAARTSGVRKLAQESMRRSSIAVSMTSAAIAASVPSGARTGSMIAERSPSSGNSRYG
jgi:hypothetical protein